ncbi:MAG: hypothetical protein MN733_15055 [Nitrososphaera sp.]|nr:hypothetical protein [Nitrososphaera sp.]
MTPNTQAYKRHLIQRNPFTDDWTVTKDGHHITTVSSLQAAKLAIDCITNQ